MTESVHKRRARANREIRQSLGITNAADAIGELEHGCEVYGLSDGSFSLVDILVHVLDTTGPADVVVSTWTAAGADIDFALRLLADGRIRSIRFVVDFSFPIRQPAYCAALRERFGDDAIRVTKNHAKFCTVTNDAWAMVIRTSMNLNENRRLESFEISDDRGLADYLAGVVARLFAEFDGAAQLAARPYENVKGFEKFVDGHATDAEAERRALAGDRGKYFGDGKYATDVRRAGVAWKPSRPIG